MTAIFNWLGVVGVTSSLLLACSSDDGHGYTRPVGRGSAACQAWQKAFCDFAAVECGLTTEASCVDTYYAVSCNSDANAQNCATQLDNSTCNMGMPAGCNLTDLADPAPAVTACNNMLTAYCAKGASCGKTTADACLALMQSQLDCTKAIGYTANYESCMSGIANLACTASASPATCDGVIRTTK